MTVVLYQLYLQVAKISNICLGGSSLNLPFFLTQRSLDQVQITPLWRCECNYVFFMFEVRISQSVGQFAPDILPVTGLAFLFQAVQMGSTCCSCVHLHKGISRRIGNFYRLGFSLSVKKKDKPWQTPSRFSYMWERDGDTPFPLLPSENMPLRTNQLPSASQLSSDHHMTKYYKDCY